MKLRAKGSDKADLLSGRIELDPAGERAPTVTLDGGHSLGSLVDVLDRFSVEEVSSEEEDAIREAFLGRDLVARARHLDEIVDHAENAIRRLLGECESFREHAAACGFQVTPGPGLPGSQWSPSIEAARWNWFDPEPRLRILRALLIGIDWKAKMREWNFDPIAVKVVGSKGERLDEIQLRDGYWGPIA